MTLELLLILFHLLCSLYITLSLNGAVDTQETRRSNLQGLQAQAHLAKSKEGTDWLFVDERAERTLSSTVSSVPPAPRDGINSDTTFSSPESSIEIASTPASMSQTASNSKREGGEINTSLLSKLVEEVVILNKSCVHAAQATQSKLDELIYGVRAVVGAISAQNTTLEALAQVQASQAVALAEQHQEMLKLHREHQARQQWQWAVSNTDVGSFDLSLPLCLHSASSVSDDLARLILLTFNRGKQLKLNYYVNRLQPIAGKSIKETRDLFFERLADQIEQLTGSRPRVIVEPATEANASQAGSLDYWITRGD